jgi:hypothetical protein
MSRYVPHTERHPEASRALPTSPDAVRRQGDGPTRPGPSPIWFGAIVLGVFALASMLLGALPWALS